MVAATSVVPEVGEAEAGDPESKTSLDYMVRSFLK
jgi:hypothetical protein